MKKALNLYTPRNYATFSSQSYYKYKTTTRKTRASCKLKFTSQQSQESSLDPVPSSIRARNAQDINIINCDVTTWSWVNLVIPALFPVPSLWVRPRAIKVSTSLSILGLCRSWTLDWTLDCTLDWTRGLDYLEYGLDYGLDYGLSRLMLPDVTIDSRVT